ncbi:MAG: asparaginase [Paludibacteraceae bacterium]|nr:asparaginase [Paludibacteraceae bacterium]
MKRVLVILTGGTITMVRNPQSGALRPADVETFKAFVPELFAGNVEVDMLPFNPLIDSSDISPANWTRMANAVVTNYTKYDGFVILHGTDTMSYSASALSFMLENLSKPIVFTGSQLPVGVLRSDAKENLLTAIEIAATARPDGQPMVPEVTIFFEDSLFRANRTTKKNAEHFEAFDSYNYPSLAKAGVHITYRPHLIRYPETLSPLFTHMHTCTDVAILKLFPGINEAVVRAVLNTEGLKGVVLETYGSGNAPSAQWLYKALKQATDKGIIIVNKTQCSMGSVDMGQYEVAKNLLKAGVISGYDITTEALLTKMMTLLGEHPNDTDRIKHLLSIPICGEMTISK